MRKIGIVGCGVIGTEIALAIDKKKIMADLVAIYDINHNKSEELLHKLKKVSPKIVTELKELVDISELVIETATPKVVPELAKLTLNRKKDIFVLSVGGLLANQWIFQLAKKNNSKVYFPSGAIVGIDGLKASKFGKIKSVSLTTSKPISTLINNPYFKKYRDNLSSIKKPKIIYEGNAKDAIKYFPQNINVAGTIAISGIGSEKTKVKIIALPDKKINKNIHEIEIITNFGRIYTKTENLPSKENPKTSQLAIYSAISTLAELCNK
jgi:aspartate dehydrogenase